MLGKGPLDLTCSQILEEMSHRASNPAVEDAIRVFAATRHWPVLTERERFAVCLRLEFGKEYCAGFGASMGEEEEHPIDFVESLLIEYWLDVGRGNWMYERFVQAE